MFRKYLKRPITFGSEYRSLRNRLNNLIASNKRLYYRTQFEINQGNCKKTWDLISQILNRKKLAFKETSLSINDFQVSDRLQVSEYFNDYFCNVATELTSQIPNQLVSFESFLTGDYSSSFCLREILPCEIETIILNLKETSVGHDGIPCKVLKSISSIISVPISVVINDSIRIGEFPDELKVSKIVPVFKSGLSDQMNNYRPISILTTISKIFEKFLCEQILYLEKKNILTKYQFGFRKKISTDVAIANFLKDVVEGVDSGEYCIGVFLDLRKAFDLVNHQILFKKMEFYGIRGIVLSLVKSYFSNRFQYVSINGVLSNKTKLNNIGVPQGSVLGPLFFLIYINDLIYSSSFLKFSLFADDTTIFCKSTNIDELYDKCNLELNHVMRWISANKLILNYDKTVYMLFTGRKFYK